MEYFAAVYLDRHDEIAESAEQIMRATAAVVVTAGGTMREPFIVEADTGQNSPGLVISTAELTAADATKLWTAYPFDENTLDEWKSRGWEAVGGE